MTSKRTLPPLSFAVRAWLSVIAQIAFAVGLMVFVGLVAPRPPLFARYAAVPSLRIEDALRVGLCAVAPVSLGLSIRRAAGRTVVTVAKVAALSVVELLGAVVMLAVAAIGVQKSLLDGPTKAAMLRGAGVRCLVAFALFLPPILLLRGRRTAASWPAARDTARNVLIGAIVMTVVAYVMARKTG